MIEFATLIPKTCSYLTSNNNENKKSNGTKKGATKRKLKFEDYNHRLEATQLENKINHLEKNKLDVDSLRENLKEFIKNNNLILKSDQIFREKKHNVFTEEVNKIPLSVNKDKRIQ